MRPFILRNLKTVQDLSPKDRFENEADIDVGDFPYLFREYWHDVFKHRFDPDRDVRSAIGLITEARNQVAHPESEDMEFGYALARLHEIADILGQINTPEQKRDVEAIRDKLLTNTAPIAETNVRTPMSLRAPSESRSSPPTFKRSLKGKRKRQNTAKPKSSLIKHTSPPDSENC